MTSNTPPLGAPFARLADALSPLAGQRIALIAPAGGVQDERIDTALAVLATAGIDAHLGAHARDHHRYLAGTADARLADLHAAFELPGVAAVWCLRGGYGCAHLVNHIDWGRIPADVPLIGFSDITVLLEAFRQHGRAAIHGPVATQLASPGETAEAQDARAAAMASVVDRLQNRPSTWALTHLAGPTVPVAGQLVGGNLTTLACMAGTLTALRLEQDAILLLEDIGEAEFRLERSFQQLMDTIDADRLRAVCLGAFSDCTLADGLNSLGEIFAEWLGDTPLYAGLPMSHEHMNAAWRPGSQASIEDGQLRVASAGTARTAEP
ncbi:S66 peptidase family protein [Salinisphaera hydrothermalis]|uniref:S66 peptidase family protein n=1 Tax=Salinisphaera hydrothermalis TaxID=563188 RepID=UPI00333F628B